MTRTSQHHGAGPGRKRYEHSSKRGQHASGSEQQFSDLLFAGIEFAYGESADSAALTESAGSLAAIEAEGHRRMIELYASQVIISGVTGIFESGWQPAEFVHAVRRDWPNRITKLAREALADHTARTSALRRAPEEWREQLLELDAPVRAVGGHCIIGHWRNTVNGNVDDARSDDARKDYVAPSQAWREVMQLLGWISHLGKLAVLMPPPSRWADPGWDGQPRSEQDAQWRSAQAASGAEPKVLARIRGLLAKAESSTFSAEAEALTAKAQDLMTRYAIDLAVLDAQNQTCLQERVRTRRLRIHNPYPEAKVQLLHSVAMTNNVKAIWQGHYGLASMVGMAADMDLCELLFTSLLVQATQAMSEAGTARNENRSASYRRSFLLAYATRVRERLEIARKNADRDARGKHGSSLVPILAQRAEAVDSVFDEQFPESSPLPLSVSNSRGWYEGRAAADTADLTGGCGTLSAASA